MSRFLSFLDIKEPIKSQLPQDIIDGGTLIDGLQMIYEEMPSGAKKDNFAIVIAETATILMKAINEIKINGLPKQTIQNELKAIGQTPITPIQNIHTPTPQIQNTPPTKTPKSQIPQNDEKSEQQKFLKHILTEIDNIEF